MFVDTLRARIIRHRLAKSTASPVVNPASSEFEVDNWVMSEFVLGRLIPIVGVHPFPLDELLLMSSTLCRLRPRHVFEWGTHIGKSARVFYETSRRFRTGTTVHSIDLPDDVPHVEHPGRRRARLVRGIRDVKLYQGDGLDVAIGLCRSIRGDGPFLFFLDGDHSYESVKREIAGVTENFPEASMLVHDTFFQSAESHYNIGPHEAVKSFLRDRGGSYKFISTSMGLPGMTLLFRSKV